MVPWCRAQKIEVTRSRAYKKNDQAFVEQKNGAVVRRLVGYGRFEGVETARILVRLYAASRLHTNYFQPSFKLKDKRREGAKVIKRYHAPATPYARALAHPKLSSAVKQRLREALSHVSIRWRCWPRSVDARTPASASASPGGGLLRQLTPARQSCSPSHVRSERTQALARFARPTGV